MLSKLRPQPESLLRSGNQLQRPSRRVLESELAAEGQQAIDSLLSKLPQAKT
jgi:hypothetical protein